jgi:hypothetical protein
MRIASELKLKLTEGEETSDDPVSDQADDGGPELGRPSETDRIARRGGDQLYGYSRWRGGCCLHSVSVGHIFLV